MPIIQTMNEHDFAYELSKNKDNGFTYEGAKYLYDIIYDEDINIEFDNVAIRSDYSEYTTEEFIKEFDIYGEYKDMLIEEDELGNKTIEEHLEEETLFEQYYDIVISNQDGVLGGDKDHIIILG